MIAWRRHHEIGLRRPHGPIAVELALLQVVTEVVELLMASSGFIRFAGELGVDVVSRFYHASPVELVLRMQLRIEHKAQSVTRRS